MGNLVLCQGLAGADQVEGEYVRPDRQADDSPSWSVSTQSQQKFKNGPVQQDLWDSRSLFSWSGLKPVSLLKSPKSGIPAWGLGIDCDI